MKIEQISIFLENKPGRLAEVTKTLAAANINIKALSLADTSEFGILRLIVAEHTTARDALKSQGFTVAQTSVVAVEIPHAPGGLDAVLQTMADSSVNVEYMYGFPYKSDNAVMIFRFDDCDKGIESLKARNFNILSNGQVFK